MADTWFDGEGKPTQVLSFDVQALPMIERDALPGLPKAMEGRLFNPGNGMEPAMVLFHPFSELYLLVRLTDLENLPHHVEQLNIAVLKQAMGEPPEEQGYRTEAPLPTGLKGIFGSH